MDGFRWHRIAAAFALAALAFVPATVAQRPTGDLSTVVQDNAGERLPGVTVTIEGQGAPKIRVTDARGQAFFPALDPGRVQLRAELEGFSTVEYPNIVIAASRNTNIEVTLTPAVEEVITVTSESPLLDEKRISTGTTISQVELEKIPTARDPWSLLNQTQGVIVDRVNVGGNESGQQSVFLGQGVTDDENNFLVDGVQITDMAAIGSSATYYDFDQFTEMQISTGGSDVTTATAGVSVNLVTKRGTNEFRGSGRYMVTDGQPGFFGIFEQADPSISSSDLAPGQAGFEGNRIQRVEDWGFEAGGPVIVDKLWVWGSFGQNDIKNDIPGGGGIFLNDDTILENAALKINAQLSGSNSAQGSWNNGNKLKFGRNAAPTRPTETTWDQRGPTAIIKAEDTHVFSSNLFLTAGWSKVDGGFSLTAKGGVGPDAPEAWRDGSLVWHDGFLSGFAKRPSEELKADGSYFFNAGLGTHELKFGARMREFEDIDQFSWPGRNVFSLAQGGGAVPLVVARRGGAPANAIDYQSAWVQDTFSRGNLTVNVGLRYDQQEGENLPAFVEGPEASIEVIGPSGELTTLGTLMPSLDIQGSDAPFDWSSITPRIGVTYALGEERRTLLRGSFSQFAEQLESSDIVRLNPGYYAYGYFLNLTDYYAGPDPNHRFDTGDVLYFLFSGYFDARNPTAVANLTDPGLDPPLTSEAILAIEHAFLPEFVGGVTLTYRNTSDVLETRELVRQANTLGLPGRTTTPADYVGDGMLAGTLPDGTPYSVPLFTLRPDLEFTGGNLLLNGDREVEYTGLAVNFTKRLANRWMARGYFQWGEAEWDIPDSYLQFNNPNPEEIGSDDDGGPFAVQAAGSGAKADVILQSTWSWNLTGMYQVAPDRGWGFNVAANLYGREGYPLPYYENVTLSDGSTRDIRIVDHIDEFRTDDIFTTDLRLEKEFAATGNVGFTVSLDAFNIFNENAVLQRERDLSANSADFLRETLSPRIYRLGVRLNWR